MIGIAAAIIAGIPAVGVLWAYSAWSHDRVIADRVGKVCDEITWGKSHDWTTTAGMGAFADRITAIYISHRTIDRATMADITSLSDVTVLDFSQCSLPRGSLPKLLQKCPQLRSLWLYGSDITYADLNGIVECRHLEAINLEFTSLTDAEMAAIHAAVPDCRIYPFTTDVAHFTMPAGISGSESRGPIWGSGTAQPSQ